MEYLLFSVGFTLIHTVAYTIAGAIVLRFSKDLYEKKNRLLDYLNDMSVEAENKHVAKWFLPAQLLRGVLMSVVLYPVLGFLGELTFGLRFAFLAGLMFFYTDLTSAVPFPNNIEGFVYLKKRYLKKGLFWKLYFETILYSLAFAGLVSWLLF
ncbi:MAG: hypothetical protein ACQEQU_08455 [Spirochaetota bacterium]